MNRPKSCVAPVLIVAGILLAIVAIYGTGYFVGSDLYTGGSDAISTPAYRTRRFYATAKQQAAKAPGRWQWQRLTPSDSPARTGTACGSMHFSEVCVDEFAKLVGDP
jgi:hypothetical protein